LRFLYGFDSPVNRALGFGKSLHDALCEIHGESIRGNVPSVADVPQLVERHLHLPFANEEVRVNSVRGAEKALRQYLNKHGEHLTRLEHAEKTVELKLADGVVVSGRIGLISPNRYQRNRDRRLQIQREHSTAGNDAPSASRLRSWLSEGDWQRRRSA
jgi:DNA helicase-2/ATP-dependent DNA helicase PcrA